VQNKVNGVHDLCKHSLGARRLRVAKREPDQSRQGLAWAVSVQRANGARMPRISLRCTDLSNSSSFWRSRKRVPMVVTRTPLSSSIPGGSPIEPDGVCPPTASGPVPATRSGSGA
jgi:hypothetical protein